MKKLLIPMKLLAGEALLGHLRDVHPSRTALENELARRRSGWRGEQNLAYYLDPLDLRIFYDLHLDGCQIDTLILHPFFLTIFEVKNYTGTIIFESEYGQVIRCSDNRREGFPNPILQTLRHQSALRQWLNRRNLPQLPIEARVIFAHPGTIIENRCRSPLIVERVIHAEQAPLQIEQLISKHNRDHGHGWQQISNALLAAHTEPFPNIMKAFNIQPAELQCGIRCPHCGSFDTQRIYAGWHCPHCGITSKTAHQPMILHHFLLHGPTMTNRQCREFLGLAPSQRHIVNYLLKKMNLKISGSGTGRGLYYKAPTHEQLHDYFLPKISQTFYRRHFNR
ncbi:NERD domain-containing protein [Sporolactobacillus sp. CPB3-1]|uniref:NERD domain-containing protein n=1 Tax=Sporolactobacillus mangiferae TaxID=2940498 RepID=A0ABT0M982_9BACL|nr:nuclease-related domain-containing protein [Sporolactobacillus mangiferae]MCL1631193.1 NERD domain-containing protein [Sporolactobacillus mangiferae]